MINYEITKTKKIKEVNNDMVHNYYYLIYGRLLNESKTKQIRFKYIQWFDIFDIQECFEKDIVTKKDIKEYVQDMSMPYELENIKDFDDKKAIDCFIDFCNETIKEYNETL